MTVKAASRPSTDLDNGRECVFYGVPGFVRVLVV